MKILRKTVLQSLQLVVHEIYVRKHGLGERNICTHRDGKSSSLTKSLQPSNPTVLLKDL